MRNVNNKNGVATRGTANATEPMSVEGEGRQFDDGKTRIALDTRLSKIQVPTHKVMNAVPD